MNSSQQQFLNKGKKASVKNPNTEADPVPLHYFGQNSNSPPLGTQRAFGGFSKFKKRRFWPTYAFQRFPWISSLFHTVFNSKSLTFTARPLAYRSACQSATYTNAGLISQKFVFMLHQSSKNNKFGSVKNSRGIIWTLQADFSKGFDIGFFKGVSDDLQKVLSSDKITDPDLRKKTTKTLARFLNRNRTNR